jgi:hypothetical protein
MRNKDWKVEGKRIDLSPKILIPSDMIKLKSVKNFYKENREFRMEVNKKRNFIGMLYSYVFYIKIGVKREKLESPKRQKSPISEEIKHQETPEEIEDSLKNIPSFECYAQLNTLINRDKRLKSNSKRCFRIKHQTQLTIDNTDVEQEANPDKITVETSNVGLSISPNNLYGLRRYKSMRYKSINNHAKRANTARNDNRRKGSQGKSQPRQVQNLEPPKTYVEGSNKKINDNRYNNDPDALLIMLRRLEGKAQKQNSKNKVECKFTF